MAVWRLVVRVGAGVATALVLGACSSGGDGSPGSAAAIRTVASGVAEPASPTSAPDTRQPVSAERARVSVLSTLGVDTSVSELREDYVQVQAIRSGVALASFDASWTRGAQADVPKKAATRDVFFSNLVVTTVPNLAKPNKNQRLVQVELWIPKGATGPTVALQMRPAIAEMTATLTTGTRPGLSFAALPERTFSVSMTTDGRDGVNVITTGNGCKKSTKRQHMRYSGTNSPGRPYTGAFTDPNTPYCHGYPRGTKLD